MHPNTPGPGPLSLLFTTCLPVLKDLFKPRGQTNTQVRSDHPAQRPLFLPTRAEYDPPVAAPRRVKTRSSRNSRNTTTSRMRTAKRFPTCASYNSGSTATASARSSGDGRWSASDLSEQPLAELFATIHTTLSHVPYAICGLGALVDHGFAARRPKQISILCPSFAKDNVRAWLAARGYDTYGDSVAIPIGERGEDGRRQVRRVRIKYLDKGFDRLERVKSSFSDAWILGLASQLDHVAAGFVDHYRRLQQKKRDRDDINTTNTNTNTKEIDNEERALQSMAGDIFFCLDKAARTRHTLNPELLSTFLSEAFWTSFTSRHDNARTEMARAGIDVAAVLAKHRDEKALREHEEMLKMFGGGDAGVVAEQPGPFEGMRTLGDGGNTKSVYSIASSSGYDKMLPPPPPLPPTVPDVPAPLRRLQRLRRPQGAEGGGGGGGKRASKRKPVIPERTCSQCRTHLVASASPKNQSH
ncbi:hypothetical protein F4821DRAFT_250093 [Hypoxylon rubiginosum]|uniref:Uncharacterized protein n=1 Tax=Hypoxylon rubiginosum TaxID=110542 RepID=A0ACC0CL68_9PEZI|nr:hypothetical protein F4821DRAFT_250093 [Hypoxylon rubiginosum]